MNESANLRNSWPAFGADDLAAMTAEELAEAAGGGKTDLMLGLGITDHRKMLFLRREAVQLKPAVERLKEIVGAAGSWRSSGHGGVYRLGHRTVEFAGCEHEDDKQKYQGHDDDLKCFDE